MIHRLCLIAALLGLTGCVAVIAPCAEGQDGGIGNSGTCVTTPLSILG
ncbi:hypothetical protein [Yoonia sp. SS1-5]|uniref:Lipoprotein n=1 Tax=Yoonia rhodophyticola TaxID=3137370 RepID=A0AAN0MDC7_9RHOB